ncbi:MAG: Ig-like domain-containing protein [Candidatus Parcubacteria bacterium]|nr:Ig-like domain-containing protein [Candidatus Parcubacteria bacterium]
MKKFTFFLVILGVLFSVNFSLAFDTQSIVKTEVPYDTFFRGTFDNLVFDFTLVTARPDTLKALSLQNLGTLTDAYQLDYLTLWADDGPVGFQGMGIDRKIGNLIYFSTLQNWYLNNLSENIADSQRYFVSAEISSYITKTGSVQMQIPKLIDTNANGSFDLGDMGIFMDSGNNGPTNANIVNDNVQVVGLTTVDSLGPKVNFTNLQAGQTIESDSFVIKGMIRDQGATSIKDRFIYIDGQKNVISIFDDTTYTWQYVWQNIATGEHKIKVTSSDQGSNPGQSEEITVNVAIAVPPVVPPTTPVNAYKAGDLIKASGAALYYFGNDGKRYVFPNLNTYKTWYPDFLNIVTIADLDLGTITIGGNVTYKPGVKLVKITTDPKVYAVGPKGTLRWVTTEAIAVALYGANWGSLVEDVPDPFFVNYTVGLPISSTSDFSPITVQNAATSINVDKGL